MSGKPKTNAQKLAERQAAEKREIEQKKTELERQRRELESEREQAREEAEREMERILEERRKAEEEARTLDRLRQESGLSSSSSNVFPSGGIPNVPVESKGTKMSQTRLSEQVVFDHDFAKDIAHDNFDPLKMIDKLISAGLTPKDLSKLITLVYVRGNKTTNVVKNCANTTGPDEMNSLFLKYGISDSVSDKKNVTLSRIVNCFPQAMAKVCKSLGSGLVVNVPSDICPVYLQFPGAASIIPKGYVNTFNRHIAYLWMFNSQIGGNIEVVVKYAKVSQDSPLFTNEEREKIMGNLGQMSDLDQMDQSPLAWFLDNGLSQTSNRNKAKKKDYDNLL
jgi:hypothetical protein